MLQRYLPASSCTGIYHNTIFVSSAGTALMLGVVIIGTYIVATVQCCQTVNKIASLITREAQHCAHNKHAIISAIAKSY